MSINTEVEKFHHQDRDRSYQVLYTVPIFFTICTIKSIYMGVKVIETSPTYLCRDLFCRAVIAANMYDKFEELRYASEKLNKDTVYLAVGTNHKNVARLNNLDFLKPLHDLEDRLGFKRTSRLFVCSQNFIHKEDTYLPDSPTRCILELDGRWLSNSIMASFLTGMVRAKIMNMDFLNYSSDYFLKTLENGGAWSYNGGIYDYDYEDDDDQDGMLERSYQEFVKIMGLFIDNYSKAFDKPSRYLFGVDLSQYNINKDGSRYESIRNSADFFSPWYSGGNGIRWFLQSIYNGYNVKIFREPVQKLIQLYKV